MKRKRKPNLRTLITSALRRIWLYSAERQSALKLARVGKLYTCNTCKLNFPLKQTNVDHIEPVGKFQDYNTLIERLFCQVDNLQVLCKDCHRKK